MWRLVVMQIVLIGPPGAGKGTQSVRLAEYLQVAHLSTGDMLREACRRQTDVGKRAAEAMSRGQLVSDQLVEEVVFERLVEPDCQSGYILDGFPRTVPQAESLDQWLAKRQEPLSLVLELRVADEELLRRLSERGRQDDDREVVLARLGHYNELTRPLLDYYRNQHLLKEVDGLGDVDEIAARIQQAVRAWQKSARDTDSPAAN